MTILFIFCPQVYSSWKHIISTAVVPQYSWTGKSWTGRLVVLVVAVWPGCFNAISLHFHGDNNLYLQPLINQTILLQLTFQRGSMYYLIRVPERVFVGFILVHFLGLLTLLFYLMHWYLHSEMAKYWASRADNDLNSVVTVDCQVMRTKNVIDISIL